MLPLLENICKRVDATWMRRSRILDTFSVVRAQVARFSHQVGGIEGVATNTSGMALLKASDKIGSSGFERIAEDLRPKTPLNGHIIAVDGSKVKLGPKMRERGFKKSCNTSEHAHALISGMYDVTNNQLLNMSVTPNMSERTAFLEQLKPEMKGATFVFDRGYYSCDLADFLDKNGYRFVFRLRNNIRNFSSRFSFIRFSNDDHTFSLLSNLRKRSNLGSIYKKRWSIELYFKHLKHTLNGRLFSSRSISRIRIELACRSIADYIRKHLSCGATVSHRYKGNQASRLF